MFDRFEQFNINVLYGDVFEQKDIVAIEALTPYADHHCLCVVHSPLSQEILIFKTHNKPINEIIAQTQFFRDMVNMERRLSESKSLLTAASKYQNSFAKAYIDLVLEFIGETPVAQLADLSGFDTLLSIET
jgi:hypothetical protein